MKQYIVDAFADQVFAGNPAAICIWDHWPAEQLMMSITVENNLSETAFAVKEKTGYRLRWFTPGGEIDLCGHATLACAYVLLRFFEKDRSSVQFQTKSGPLMVVKNCDRYEMDFPAYELTEKKVTAEMEEALGVRPAEAWMGRDLVCVLEDEQQILDITPNLSRVEKLDGLLLHVTAKGRSFDCVSRTFAPKCKVNEDAVCGSGHCHLVPFWANRLKKQKIIARQASRRGGTLYCKYSGDRVKLAGQAVLYSVAELFPDGIPNSKS